ncbi:MAG: phosphate transport system substrate-binding protein [Pseudomonadota bacterium]|nr:phosphate transport system substrate-binding protein [Pseudomonadota bacterium]
MSRAVCTNLPAACSKAASRVLLPLNATQDRCPECGAALLPVDAAVESSPAGGARWVVPAIGVAIVAVAGLLLSGRGPTGPATASAPAASALESAPPGAGQPAVLTLHGAGLLGTDLLLGQIEAFLRIDGLKDPRRPEGAGALLLARTAAGGRLEVRLEAAVAAQDAAGLRRVSLLGDDIAPGDVTLGLDALAVIVHPDHPLRSLTPGQLRQRLLGRQGRPDGVHLPADPGLLDLISRQLLAGEALPAALPTHTDLKALVQAVADEPGAIGLVPLSAVGAARVLPVGDATGAAWLPQPQTLATERYPLTHRIVMHLPEGSDPRLQRLASYLSGPAAQQQLAARMAVGAHPQLLPEGQPAPVDAGSAPRLPRDYTALIRQARLLSSHIDFAAGADTLDAVGRAEVERIGRQIAAGQVPRGAAVLVLAAANDPGSVCGNRQLSERRAEEVAQHLRSLGVAVDVAHGIGRVSPGGLDGTAVATLERRAEIWISEGPVVEPPPWRCGSPAAPSRAPEAAPAATEGGASTPAA